jgi:hypothetical protein
VVGGEDNSTNRLIVEPRNIGEIPSNFTNYKLLSVLSITILSLLLNFVMLSRQPVTKHMCDYDYLTNINWEKELRINPKGHILKTMPKFLNDYFLLTENKLTLTTTSNNLPNNSKCLETHWMIMNNYFAIIEKRKEIKHVLVKLDSMEKHLVWGMFYNWMEDLVGKDDKKFDREISKLEELEVKDDKRSI